ncbi:MAG: RDD family protein, partial [Terriglobales bacterium]
MMTALNTTRLTPTELGNYLAGDDPDVFESVKAEPVDAEPVSEANIAEPVVRIDASETASLEQTADSNSVPDLDPKPDSWHVEVAARLERYRTRRKPRLPRYPSLLLPFDAPESWSRPASLTNSAAVAAAPALDEQDFAFGVREEAISAEVGRFAESRHETERPASERYPAEQAPEPSAKVIEFPRSAAIPVFRSSELADPIFDRPRIVEAPEILPPPPALGGMLIEPAQQASTDSRAGADFQFASASIGRRALAALVDGAVITGALVFCATIFLRLNPSLNPVRGSLPGSLTTMAAALGMVAVLLAAAYEFLFVVYTGSTPGLRAARLRLAAFDGSPLNRRSRRWRVLASFLSAFSAGLGYLWCVLDQDGLCWHDRITRTHIQSAAQTE